MMNIAGLIFQMISKLQGMYKLVALKPSRIRNTELFAELWRDLNLSILLTVSKLGSSLELRCSCLL